MSIEEKKQAAKEAKFEDLVRVIVYAYNQEGEMRIFGNFDNIQSAVKSVQEFDKDDPEHNLRFIITSGIHI